MARNREKNREKVKEERREENLERYNEVSLKDLTPYNSVRVINGKDIVYK